ncbi:MAG: hypothetical protein KKB30_15730 [Proteobacteria bacterium]|nr:hypothetical protein [Pseudomonadota bacterium]MBU1714472.1 hypothetical protein [Pseudomonadota bacterium]
MLPTCRHSPSRANTCNFNRYKRSAWLIVLLALILGGCASAKLTDARREFHAGYPTRAYDILSKVKSYPARDKLLFHLEMGVILFNLGRYEQSTAEFLAAARLKKEQEIISISEQAGSLITTEWLTEYKGEYGERLWIHTYLMMNFLLQAKYEDALVEAKQALELYEKYPEVLAEDYFTRTLIAICYELLGEYNDAYIEYKSLFSQLPDKKNLAGELYYLAHRLGFSDESTQYAAYLNKEEQDFWQNPPETEIVIFAELGRAPDKIPGNIVVPPTIRFSFPQYRNDYDNDYFIDLIHPEKKGQISKTTTEVREVLVTSLEARAKSMIVKETARVAIKEALAQAIEENNGAAAGALTRAILFLSEEPDTRGWETLPAEFALLRIRLHPGTHDLVIAIKDYYGNTIEKIDLPEVKLYPGQNFFKAIKWPEAMSEKVEESTN